MTCNCIAGITTYNPKIERLQLNVEAIMNQVKEVLIIDNASDNIRQIESIFFKYENLRIIKNKSNMGIAYAMNIIGKYASNNGYDWFLTLDQDSVCPANLVEIYAQYIDSNVGIIAPYIHFNNSFISQLLHLNNNEIIDERKVKTVDYVISSGQFIQTKVWEKVDGFWEYLFIDYVDQEFCFHVSKMGYKILQIRDIELSHEPGIPVKVMGIMTAKQSAFREYYWARNSRIVYWMYKKEYMNAIGRLPFWSSMKRVANVILVRENIAIKLKAIFAGIVDAHFWKKNNKKNQRIPLSVDENRRYK